MFDEKQKFVSSVFEEYLQTDKGKHYVRYHKKDYNAQAVYRKLTHYATLSTHASLNSTFFLEYDSSQSIVDSAWCGTTHAFILKWCDKLRQYEELIDPKGHFTDFLKKVMLQIGVRGVQDQYRVNTQQDNHNIGQGKKHLSYDKYLDFRLSDDKVDPHT